MNLGRQLMDEVISYCGLSCRTCPIYLASKETNEINKKEMINGIIRECKEHYGIEYNFEDINECDGCKSLSGRIFSGCLKCTVRACAIQKGVENCVYCEDYPCDNLNELFEAAPEAKKSLDLLQKNLGIS